MTQIKGFDRSHWQPTLDAAAALKAGYAFCFSKVSEGMGYDDPTWNATRVEAQQRGLLIAGYHLGRNDAVGGAQYTRYALLCPDGPAVLDVEAGPAMSDATSDAWVAAAKADGRTVIVYGIYAEIKRHRPSLLWSTNLQAVGDSEFTQEGSAGVYGDLDFYHGTLGELDATFGGSMADTYGDMLVKAGLGVGDAAGNENFLTGVRFKARGITTTDPLYVAHAGSIDFVTGYNWSPSGGALDPLHTHPVVGATGAPNP